MRKIFNGFHVYIYKFFGCDRHKRLIFMNKKCNINKKNTPRIYLMRAFLLTTLIECVT